MPIVVRHQGKVIRFPDGMSSADISSAMDQIAAPATPAPAPAAQAKLAYDDLFGSGTEIGAEARAAMVGEDRPVPQQPGADELLARNLIQNYAPAVTEGVVPLVRSVPSGVTNLADAMGNVADTINAAGAYLPDKYLGTNIRQYQTASPMGPQNVAGNAQAARQVLDQTLAPPQSVPGQVIEGLGTSAIQAAPLMAAAAPLQIPGFVGGAVTNVAGPYLGPLAARVLGGVASMGAGGAEFGVASSVPTAINEGSVQPIIQGATAPIVDPAILAQKIVTGNISQTTPDEWINAGFLALGGAKGFMDYRANLAQSRQLAGMLMDAPPETIYAVRNRVHGEAQTGNINAVTAAQEIDRAIAERFSPVRRGELSPTSEPRQPNPIVSFEQPPARPTIVTDPAAPRDPQASIATLAPRPMEAPRATESGQIPGASAGQVGASAADQTGNVENRLDQPQLAVPTENRAPVSEDVPAVVPSVASVVAREGPSSGAQPGNVGKVEPKPDAPQEVELPDSAKRAGIKSWKDAQKKGVSSFVVEADVTAKNILAPLEQYATTDSLARTVAEQAIRGALVSGNSKEGWLSAAKHLESMAKNPDLANNKDILQKAAKTVRDYVSADSQPPTPQRTAPAPKAAADAVDTPSPSERGTVAGRQSVLRLSDNRELPVTYRVIEADELIPSHDARKGFAINPGGDANQRPYHDPEQGRSSRQAVQEIAVRPKPDLLLTDTPTPIDGPPVTGPDNVVLGGNARTMGIQLAYSRNGKQAATIRQATIDAASKFGIDPAVVQGMKHPVIVRTLADGGARGELSADLNRSLTTGKTGAVDAASRAAKVSDRTSAMVGSMLSSETAGDNPSLREIMADPKASSRLVQSLVKDGAFSMADIDGMTDPRTGALTNAGKIAIEDMMLARVVPDPSSLGRMPGQVRQNLMASIGHLTRIAASGDAGKQFIKWVQNAVESFPEFKASGLSAKEFYIDQQTMTPPAGFGEPAVAAIADALNKVKARRFKSAVEGFMDRAGIEDPSAGPKFGFATQETAPNPREATLAAMAEAQKYGGRDSEVAAMRNTPETVNAASLTRNQPATGKTSTGSDAKVYSRKEIAEHFEKLVGVPIRWGSIRSRAALGTWNRLTQVIRAKMAYDLPVMAHELGHALDDRLNLHALRGGMLPPGVEAELEALGKQYPWGKSGPPSRRKLLGEGLADAMRYYLIDDPKWQKEAPKFIEYLRQRLQAEGMLDGFDKGRAMLLSWWRADAQSRVASQLVFNHPESGSLQEWLGRSDKMLWIKHQTIDDLAYLLQATTDLNGGKRMEVSAENAYALAILTRGLSGRVEDFIRGRGVVLDDGTKLSNSLQTILAPVREISKDREEFTYYGVSKRAIELHGRGKDPGIELEDAKRFVSDIDATPRGKVYADAFDAMQKYNDALLEYMVRSGLLSKEGKALIQAANQQYIPLQRLFEPDEKLSASGGSASNNSAMGNQSTGIKAIKSSQRMILDPLEQLLSNVRHMVEAAGRNEVLQALVKQAQKAQVGQRVPPGKWIEKMPPDMVTQAVTVEQAQKRLYQLGVEFNPISGNPDDLADVMDEVIRTFSASSKPILDGRPIVRVMIGAEPKFYLLHPELYKEVMSLHPQDATFLMKVLQAPGRVFRDAVTGPWSGFPALNFARDMQDSMFYGSVTNPARLPDAVRSVFKGDEAYWRYMRSGAAYSGVVGSQAKMRDLTNIVAGPLRGWKAFRMVHQFFGDVEAFNMAGENVNRMTEFQRLYEKSLAKGKSLRDAEVIAGFTARNVTMDFGRGGEVFKSINRYIPFSNVGSQGVVKMAEAIKNNPAKTASGLAALVIAPAIASFWLNKDDPDYQELPAYRRDLFYTMPVPEKYRAEYGAKYVQIPRIPGWGLLGAAIERELHAAWKDPKNRDSITSMVKSLRDANVQADAMRNFGNSAGSVMDPIGLEDGGWIIAAYRPLIEATMNKRLFGGSPIVPRDRQSLDPSLQYSDRTSETFKYIGDKLGMSPAKLEHIFTGYTAGVGKQTLDAIDWSAGRATDTESPLLPEFRPSKLPIIRRFMVEQPASSAVSVQRWYRRVDEIDQAIESHRFLEAKGNAISDSERAARQELAKALDDWMNDGLVLPSVSPSKGIVSYRRGPIIESTMRNLTMTRDALNRVEKQSGITEYQRRVLRDELAEKLVHDAREGLTQIESKPRPARQ